MKKHKGIHFADELHKIVDMLKTSEDDFLMSYSYLSKEDYHETIKFILESINYKN